MTDVTLSSPSFCVMVIRYDKIAEFNVESKAECDQLNLAHETKIKNASAQLVIVIIILVNNQFMVNKPLNY